MTRTFDFVKPQQAVREMIAAGAVFTVRRRDDALGLSFTYKVTEGGDPDFCRAILAAVKSRPAPFYEAFRAAVQAERGAA